MDRVLIVSEEAVFVSHLEKTLIEVGFEVSTHSSEQGLETAIDNFNPEFIVVKGGSAKLSSLRVGKALKGKISYSGKVILILNANHNIDPNEINNVKMDYLLFEPLGAAKVILHILNLTKENRDEYHDRLMKIADYDVNFRKQEEKILASGKNVDQEMIHVTGKRKKEKFTHVKNQEPEAEILSDIAKELSENETMHHKKIESYDEVIANLDVDLKAGLKTRQTHDRQKALRKELMIDPGQEKLDSLDQDRQRFAIALIKESKKR